MSGGLLQKYWRTFARRSARRVFRFNRRPKPRSQSLQHRANRKILNPPRCSALHQWGTPPVPDGEVEPPMASQASSGEVTQPSPSCIEEKKVGIESPLAQETPLAQPEGKSEKATPTQASRSRRPSDPEIARPNKVGVSPERVVGLGPPPSTAEKRQSRWAQERQILIGAEQKRQSHSSEATGQEISTQGMAVIVCLMIALFVVILSLVPW